MEELERRLRSRGTDSEESIIKRLARAKEEVEEAKDLFQYTVINDDAEEAAKEIERIILGEQDE
jgi:guanylate kinase